MRQHLQGEFSLLFWVRKFSWTGRLYFVKYKHIPCSPWTTSLKSVKISAKNEKGDAGFCIINEKLLLRLVARVVYNPNYRNTLFDEFYKHARGEKKKSDVRFGEK